MSDRMESAAKFDGLPVTSGPMLNFSGVPVSPTDKLPFTDTKTGERIHVVQFENRIHVSALLFRLMTGSLTVKSAIIVCGQLDGE